VRQFRAGFVGLKSADCREQIVTGGRSRANAIGLLDRIRQDVHEWYRKTLTSGTMRLLGSKHTAVDRIAKFSSPMLDEHVSMLNQEGL
jgi:hypothetical protein